MPAFQLQVWPEILVRFECMQTQAGEVLGCAEQQAAGLYDFFGGEKEDLPGSQLPDRPRSRRTEPATLLESPG